ncbi:MAG TPA: caspase family protein [Candidatus Elarobacter sp.]|jgi:hypothetical protein
MAAALQPVAGQPGVWRAPDAPAGGSGTYAFIAGVSAYDRLDGSPGMLGLDSLYVSALTAYAFFRYLSASYEFAGGPVVEATLMLSPTPREQTIFDADPDFPITAATAPKPTLEALRTSIQSWYARLDALPLAAKQASRLFFFFSGHGLEMDPDRQLLLPADYPGPAHVFNNAISTRNLHHGLGSVPVPEQFFFIDACRNDVPSLYNLSGLMGQEVLDVTHAQCDRDAPILYASAPGGTAWQPTQPAGADDVSFFGRVLLDALLVRDSAFRPDCTTTPCSITFFPLFNYVMKTLTALLKSKNINRTRPIASGGIVRDSLVSQWTPPQPKSLLAASEKAVEGIVGFMGGLVPESFHYAVRTAPSPSAIPSAEAEELKPASAAVDRLSVDELCDALNHRSLVDFFHRAELLRWRTGGGWSPVAADEPVLQILGVEQTPDTARTVVHYEFTDTDSWYWLHAPASPASYGLLHPGSRIDRPVFALEFTMQLDASGKPTDAISDVTCRLSARNTDALLAAASVWDAYRASSAIGGAKEMVRAASVGANTLDEALMMFWNKDISPLAATVGAMVLLRTEHAVGVHAWYERLALVVAETSDAAVFCLQLLRLQGQYDADAALRYIQRISELGTPATSEACTYLISFINDYVLRSSQPGTASPFGSAFDREAFDSIAQLAAPQVSQIISDPFGRVGQALRTGGLFTTLAAPEDQLRALLLTLQ